MEEPNSEWRERYQVRAYEVGPRGVVGPWSVCNWLQETAGRHVVRLGWAIPQLAARGQTWVLARLRLELSGELRHGDEAVVTTWTAGASRVYAVREFRVENGRGEAVALATSGWLLVDLASRRPLRPPAEIAALGAGAPRAVTDSFVKLPEAAEAEWSHRVEVGHSTLDVNGHANNVAIVAWLLDALPESATVGRRLRSLEVEFRAEARCGDALIAEAGRPESGGRFAHALRSADGQRELARAVSAWVEA